MMSLLMKHISVREHRTKTSTASTRRRPKVIDRESVDGGRKIKEDTSNTRDGDRVNVRPMYCLVTYCHVNKVPHLDQLHKTPKKLVSGPCSSDDFVADTFELFCRRWRHIFRHLGVFRSQRSSFSFEQTHRELRLTNRIICLMIL